MKSLALVFAVIAAIEIYAVPHPHRHYRQHHRPRPSPVAEIVRQVPWQNIAAGGAAVSGIVLSYKVGDGVEEGLKTIAREDPGSFTKAVFPFTWLLPIALIVIIAYAGYVVRRKHQPCQKERSHYENQQK
ncbi:MAG: hypothetical protein MJ033_07270 [Victivallaceae bacterium]|nr:hypothetical protein [Victivallaceae bacterium]